MHIRRRPRLGIVKSMIALLFAALVVYAGAGSTLWAYQGQLVFEPDRTLHAGPQDFAFPVQDVSIPVQSAGKAPETLRAWWIPSAQADAKVVLYLHGNDGNVSTSVREVQPLRELGYSVLLIDYRGYGASDGRFPSEASVYEDAEAAWTYLVQSEVKPRDLYIYGHSLGGAIAIELARRHPEAAGLVVESSFTSIYEMSRLDRRYAWLPVKQFLTHRFQSIDKVAQLGLPVLYIHGTADEVVPFAMGRRLFDASGGQKVFVPIEGGRHEDNAAVGGQAFRDALRDFLR